MSGYQYDSDVRLVPPLKLIQSFINTLVLLDYFQLQLRLLEVEEEEEEEHAPR